MTLLKLQDRKAQLQASLQNLQQSFHIVTGHLQEVDYQISELEKEAAEAEEALANTVEPNVE